MENHTASITDTDSARASVIGRRADLPRGFRMQAVVGVIILAAVATAAWFLLAGSSDRQVIEDRLQVLELDATFIESDSDRGGLVYSVPRAACDDELLMVLTVGDAELDAPRDVLFETEDVGPTVLDESTVPGLLNC